MLLNHHIQLALQKNWTSIYAKLLAIVLFYGATVHIGNILGLTGTPWGTTPILWQSLDIILLTFDIITGVLLWQGKVWGVWLFFIGILLLQFLPYTFFRNYFVVQPEDNQILNGLLATEGSLVIFFIVLIYFKK